MLCACPLARAAGVSDLIKLEVLGDERTLFLYCRINRSDEDLVKGRLFIVLHYTNDDPIVAQKLRRHRVAPPSCRWRPIGSGLGIRNPYNLKIIWEMVKVPIIVDAGVGTASDAPLRGIRGGRCTHEHGIAGRKIPLPGRGDEICGVCGRLA